MHRLILAVALSVLSSVACAQTDTTAKVATWNIKGFDPISDDRADQLAQGLIVLDAEVVAVQEVRPDSIAQDIVDKANALGGDYEDPIILNQSANLNVALIFKSGVTIANARFVPNSNLGNPGLRLALAADVTIGEFDFTIITVHLKSSRDNDSRTKRTEQCTILADFMDGIAAAGDDDIVLLGDFNMIPGQDDENFAALDPNHFLLFVSTTEGFRQFTHVNGNFLDGYAVTRLRMTEYIDGSLRIFPMHRAFDRTLTSYDTKVTDHLPIVASFLTTIDSD